MRIPRIFTDQPLIANELVELPRDTSHYLTRVLRLPLQAPVRVFNGQGGEYAAQISAAGKHSVTLQLGSFDSTSNASPLHIHLGISMSRGERMDLIIQKATELGVSEISLLASERTELKLKGERLEKRLSHWQKISLSACEQCGSNVPPIIHPPIKLENWLANTTEQVKLIMQPGSGQNLHQLNPSSVALLIGPEGGFADHEVVMANQAGFDTISLGPRILRTETAPIAAISILQHHWGDLN